MSDRAMGEAHAKTAADQLQELQTMLRTELKTTGDPQFKALAETAAEVLGGLRNAFLDYREREEDAWK